MVDEVLQNRFLIQFQSWARRNSILLPVDLSQKTEDFKECLSSPDDEVIKDVNNMLESQIIPLLQQFRSEGRHASPLFQFWDDYLTNISAPLKLFISSSRHAMWDVHQYAKSKLLPCFFASNRTVYARYMPYMFLQMNRLPKQALESFSHGSFVAKLTDGTFNSVWIDYVLEATENKALNPQGESLDLPTRTTHLPDGFFLGL